jgi:hypothetical protein
LAPAASGSFARQQQIFIRPSLPDRVPVLVLLGVLSCPFYGVTPRRAVFSADGKQSFAKRNPNDEVAPKNEPAFVGGVGVIGGAFSRGSDRQGVTIGASDLEH